MKTLRLNSGLLFSINEAKNDNFFESSPLVVQHNSELEMQITVEGKAEIINHQLQGEFITDKTFKIAHYSPLEQKVFIETELNKLNEAFRFKKIRVKDADKEFICSVRSAEITVTKSEQRERDPIYGQLIVIPAEYEVNLYGTVDEYKILSR